MKKTIYIASSWKNQHAVEMLTAFLRDAGFEVTSWVENNYGENPDSSAATKTGKFDFEEWVNSPDAEKSFLFDTQGAIHCDIFIYLGRGGKDAAAECGMAYAACQSQRKPMYALWSKGEDFGLMRKMLDNWFTRYEEMVIHIIKEHG